MFKGFRSLRTAFSVTFHSRKVTQSDHSKGEMARFGEAFLQIVKFWPAKLQQTTSMLLSKFAYTISTNHLPPNLRWLLSFAVAAYLSHFCCRAKLGFCSLSDTKSSIGTRISRELSVVTRHLSDTECLFIANIPRRPAARQAVLID